LKQAVGIMKKRFPPFQNINNDIGINERLHCRDSRSALASSRLTGLAAVIPTRLSRIACLLPPLRG
jgi:hypothetical protein